MFSTVKKLACICIIACAFNIVVGLGVVSYIYAMPYKIEFAHLFSLLAYIATGSGVLLAVSCALFSACQDVNVNNDYHLEQFSKINKRLELLEQLEKNR